MQHVNKPNEIRHYGCSVSTSVINTLQQL